jgi:hypothetical protein
MAKVADTTIENGQDQVKRAVPQSTVALPLVLPAVVAATQPLHHQIVLIFATAHLKRFAHSERKRAGPQPAGEPSI